MKKTIQISILLISSMITDQLQCSSHVGKFQKVAITLGAMGIASAVAMPKYQEFQQEQAVIQEILLKPNQDTINKTNCQNLQETLSFAIATRQSGQKDVLTLFPLQLPYSQEQLVACRKNYEEKHPGVFQKNPAMIFGGDDGIIHIRVMDRQEADEFAKKVEQEQLKAQKRN